MTPTDRLKNSVVTEQQMTPMSVIEVDQQTANALSLYAASLGLSVSEYLRKHFAGTNGPQSPVDAECWLDELVEGMPEIPALPADFSAGDAYADHD